MRQRVLNVKIFSKKKVQIQFVPRDTLSHEKVIVSMKPNHYEFANSFDVYIRHGQTAARGPHAALQRFFAAPVTNCNDALPLLWASFCKGNPLKWTVFGLKMKKTSLKKNLRPAVLSIFSNLACEQKSLATPDLIH